MGFFDILTKPQSTMENEKPKANTMDAAKTYAIYGVLVGLVLGFLFTMFANILRVAGSLFAGTNNPLLLGFIVELGYASIIVLPIMVAILSVIGAGIGYGIYFVIAKVLGGTGTFEQNYYLGSRLVWPLLAAGIIIAIVSGIVSVIPVIGFIGSIINVVWLLYMFYVTIVLIAVANNISKLKAFVVWFIPLMIIVTLIGGLILSLVNLN